MQDLTPPTTVNGSTPTASQPVVPPLMTAVSMVVAADTTVAAAVVPGHAVVYVGGPQHRAGLEPAPLALRADSPVALLAFLDRARAELLHLAPELVPPAPAPNPLLLEARDAVVEDILGRLGVEPSGEVREISDTTKGDIRTARRVAERVVDQLDAAIAGDTSTCGRRRAA